MIAPEKQKPGFSEVTHDIIGLIELQWQLFQLDGREAGQRAAMALLAAITAISLCGCALILGSISCGWLLAQYTDLSVGGGMLVVTGILIVLTIAALVLSRQMITRASSAVSESTNELAENVRWIKSVLLQPNSHRNNVRADESVTRY